MWTQMCKEKLEDSTSNISNCLLGKMRFEMIKKKIFLHFSDFSKRSKCFFCKNDALAKPTTFHFADSLCSPPPLQ